MLKIKYLLGVVILAVAPVANADSYAGFKFGPMMVDLGGISNPMNGGFVFGTSKQGWGFEGEATISLLKGDFNSGFGSANVDITTLAGYAAFRNPSDTYVKVKAGLLYEDVNIGSSSANDTGLSVGLGIGWRLESGGMVELEYTIVEQDVNFLSLAFLF